jgi:Response regulator containing CheY-like receiver, AAA-type ATPase, and DNA-binding domains
MFVSKKILIADDDFGASGLLAKRLRALGAEVGPAQATLAEAVEAAAIAKPDLVLAAMRLIENAAGGADGLRKRFSAPVVFIAPHISAGAAAGLAPGDYLPADGSEREILLVLSAQLARAEAVRREEELLKKLRDEEALANLGRTAGHVAHKFNNLLTTVASASALIRMELGDDARILGHIEKLDTTVERGAALCRQLLTDSGRETRAMPAAGENSAPTIPPPVARRAGLHGAVLIVDDDESVRALARWVVEREGFPTVAARDGDEALEKFRADPGAFGLVLLDLTMPRVSGAEVLTGLRAVRPSIPVVVVTGYDATAMRDIDRAGINGFLQKPFSPDALRAILHRCAGTTPKAV